MIRKLPEPNDAVNMLWCGALIFESTMNGEIYVTDFLNRKKYKIIYSAEEKVPFIFELVEQE